MLSGRDNGYQVPHLEILAKVITVIAFVHDYRRQLGQRRALFKNSLKDRRVMAGTARQRT
jgi:hypothetical protein